MTEQASNTLSGEGTAPGVAPARKTPILFEDSALVERSRNGDMQAFGSLVMKYQDRILNLVFRMCGSRADAEELAQETFLRALSRIDQFRGNSRFYTWLFRIASNLTISHRRRGVRVKFHPLGGPEPSDGSQAEALTATMAARRNPDPPTAAMSAEAARRVTRALAELDEDFRLVALLRDVEGMDYARIAEVVGVPVGTVKSRLHRARCVLKGKLSDLVADGRYR